MQTLQYNTFLVPAKSFRTTLHVIEIYRITLQSSKYAFNPPENHGGLFLLSQKGTLSHAYPNSLKEQFTKDTYNIQFSLPQTQ